MINAAVQQRLIASAFAFQQFRLHLNLLVRLRVDLRLERLVPRQSNLDRVLPRRYQHSSPATLELTNVSHEQPIKKNSCS